MSAPAIARASASRAPRGRSKGPAAARPLPPYPPGLVRRDFDNFQGSPAAGLADARIERDHDAHGAPLYRVVLNFDTIATFTDEPSAREYIRRAGLDLEALAKARDAAGEACAALDTATCAWFDGTRDVIADAAAGAGDLEDLAGDLEALAGELEGAAGDAAGQGAQGSPAAGAAALEGLAGRVAALAGRARAQVAQMRERHGKAHSAFDECKVPELAEQVRAKVRALDDVIEDHV